MLGSAVRKNNSLQADPPSRVTVMGSQAYRAYFPIIVAEEAFIVPSAFLWTATAQPALGVVGVVLTVRICIIHLAPQT